MLGKAWEQEPPLLMQIRNLLAQLLSLTAANRGIKIPPDQFIPQRQTVEDDIDDQRNVTLIWAAQHNATLK